MLSIRRIFSPRERPTYGNWPRNTKEPLDTGFHITFPQQLWQPQIIWDGAGILDLPAELVFAILRDLSLSYVLSFALVSRACHKLAIPVLNHSLIIAQQNEPEFKKRITSKDPRNDFVHRVQLGRLDRPGYAEKWNVSDTLSGVLRGFPDLRVLEMCGGTYVKGWDGMDEIARVLGGRLTRLQLKFSVYYDDPIRSAVPTFSCVQSLEVTYVRTGYVPDKGISDLLSCLTLRFPVVADLTLTFRLMWGINQIGFIDESLGRTFPIFLGPPVHFPHLTSFNLSLPHSLSRADINEQQMDALSDFLHRHSQTLRSLVLPSYVPTSDFKSSLRLDLRKLHTSLAFAPLIAPFEGDTSMPDLQDLVLDFCLVGPNTQRYSPFREVNEEVEAAAARWPYPLIRSLTLIQPEERTDYTSIPLFCPNLEELHLDLSRAVRGLIHLPLSFARTLIWLWKSHLFDLWLKQKDRVVSMLPMLRAVTIVDHQQRRLRGEYTVVRSRGRTELKFEKSVQDQPGHYWEDL